MSASCDADALRWGLIAAPIGLFCIYIGIQAWRRPNSETVKSWLVDGYPPESQADPISRFLGWTREKAGPTNINVFRILGPLNGSIFLGVGLWMIVANIGCFPRIPYLPLGVLRFTFWPPMIPFAAFAAVIGVMNSWRIKPVYREIEVLLSIVFGIAASEAAYYHVGAQSQRWFAVALVAAGLAALIRWLGSRSP